MGNVPTPTAQKTVDLWSYEDAPDNLKKLIITKHCNINVDYDYWTFDDLYLEIAEQYGVTIRMGEVSFDLDRGSYVYFETYNHGSSPDYKKGILLDDSEKFIRKAGLDPKDVLDDDGYCPFWIDHKHFGGGDGKNIIEHNSDFSISGEHVEALQKCLDDLCNEILEALRNDYEYLTSEDAIIETLQ